MSNALKKGFLWLSGGIKCEQRRLPQIPGATPSGSLQNRKENGFESKESKLFIEGYMTAARTLNAVFKKELTDYVDRIHFEFFHMTIEERRKTEQLPPDPTDDEIEIPAYQRKGDRLKF